MYGCVKNVFVQTDDGELDFSSLGANGHLKFILGANVQYEKSVSQYFEYKNKKYTFQSITDQYNIEFISDITELNNNLKLGDRITLQVSEKNK